MKNQVPNSYDTMVKTQAEVNKQKKVERNARRKVAETWANVSNKTAYKKAAVKYYGAEATYKIENEFFDGIFISLKERHDEKSYRERKRMLRRIVEKRQAQMTHKYVGRTPDCLATYLSRQSTGKSMRTIHKYQQCA